MIDEQFKSRETRVMNFGFLIIISTYDNGL